MAVKIASEGPTQLEEMRISYAQWRFVEVGYRIFIASQFKSLLFGSLNLILRSLDQKISWLASPKIISVIEMNGMSLLPESIFEVFSRLGFTEYEAKVYAVLCACGRLKVGALSKYSNVPQCKVYDSRSQSRLECS